MVERLRALLEAPHDPAVARAVVVLACIVTVCLMTVVGLGGTGSGPVEGRSQSTLKASSSRPVPETATEHRRVRVRRTEPLQDPQDRPGTAAARRAHRELGSHRALQHLPYRRGGVAISLIGARGPRAILRVEASTVAVAHRAWRTFLRRYGDDGRAYLPAFKVKGARRG